MDIKSLSDGNNLYAAFNKTRKASCWKGSVKAYRMDLLLNLARTQKSLLNGNYTQMPYNEFYLNDRGKSRWIKACHIKDRVVLSSLCDNVLLPRLRKYLIYDNGASIKDRGITFTRKRLETHLHRYYRKHGNKGYILLVDFSKYFDNIYHKILMKMIEDKGEMLDEKVSALIFSILDSFKVDISFMEENLDEKDILYDSLSFPKCTEGKKFLHKSLGIGSPISQVLGVLYPTPMDNLCKIVYGMKYVARYMDDTYLIHKDKKFLLKILEDIKEVCKSLGIFVNLKKTHIDRIDYGFTFLKIRYKITKSGKVIKVLNSDSFKREKRRLRASRNRIEESNKNLSTIKDCINSYKSWRNNIKDFHNHLQIRKMDVRASKMIGVEIKCLTSKKTLELRN